LPARPVVGRHVRPPCRPVPVTGTWYVAEPDVTPWGWRLSGWPLLTANR